MSHARRPTILSLAAAALGLLTLAACDVPDPIGTSPLRYRDQIFTNVATTSAVEYGQATLSTTGATQKLLMDVYRPTGDTITKRPAIIWMHGGAFVTGTRTDGMMTELSKRFARRGYVAFSIDYRLTGDQCGGSEEASAQCTFAALDAAEDERAAIRFVRAHAADYGIDPNLIAIGGASAGAVSSVLAGSSPVTRPVGDVPAVSSSVLAVVSISGGLPFNGTFNEGDPPMLFWHGTADTIVPFKWAASNAGYMYRNDLIGVLHDVEGAGHVPWAQYSADMDTQSRNFLYKALNLTRAPGSPNAPKTAN